MNTNTAINLFIVQPKKHKLNPTKKLHGKHFTSIWFCLANFNNGKWDLNKFRQNRDFLLTSAPFHLSNIAVFFPENENTWIIFAGYSRVGTEPRLIWIRSQTYECAHFNDDLCISSGKNSHRLAASVSTNESFTFGLASFHTNT